MQIWNEINTEDDIEKLGSLHDSVIVSVNYNSGCSEDEQGISVWTEKDQHTASVIIDNPWTGRIELFFIGVRFCVISGFTENYSNEIYGCNIFFRTDLMGKTRDDRLIVWTDGSYTSLEKIYIDLHNKSDTLIIAEKLKWRFIKDIEEA